MNYFYLAHSVMSLVCLKDLVAKNYSPGLVIIHKERDREKLSDIFYKPIIDFCRSNQIDLIETKNINDQQKKISDFDLGLCVGFMDILEKDFYEIPKYGILNLHCGKLPEYRGRAPISRSIMDGKDFLTITVHQIDEGVDSGDICMEHEIRITTEDDVNTVYKKCSEISSEILIECLDKLKINKLRFHKQTPDLPPNKIIHIEERKINWNEDPIINFNKIRALTIPYPCAYSVCSEKKYLFIKSNLTDNDNCSEIQPGTVVKVSEQSMMIKSGKGKLEVLRITDENLTELKIEQNFKPGDKFE